MYSQVVNSNVDGYYGSLINSEITNNTAILSSNLSSRIIRQRNFIPILAELVKRNGTELTTVTQARVTKVLKSMQTVAPNTFSEVLKDFAIKPSKPADDVNALATKIVSQRQDQQFVASFARINLIDGDVYSDELTQFSSGTLKDSAVVNSNWVKDHSTTSSNIASIVRTTPERESSAAFFDHWVHGTDPNWLNNNTTMTDRLNVVMQADQTTFMGSYLDNFGMAPINQTLANLVSVSAYVQSIWEGVLHGTLNPNYTPPDVNTPGPDNLGADTLYLAEHHLYGTGRLGIKTYFPNQYRVIYQGPSTSGGQGTILDNTLNEQVPWYSLGMADWMKKDKAETYSGSAYNSTSDAVSEIRTLGMKQYEMTDHLWNVLAAVLDRKKGFGDSLSTVTGLHYYRGYYANLANVTDYYPFGMQMVGRFKRYISYRNGFNGKEKDDEVYGEGNYVDFGDRNYDSRIARWLSPDPLRTKYPAWSPYNFSMNSPIKLRDGDGRDVNVAITDNTITFSSTIYVTGPGASELAANANKAFKQFSDVSLQNRTYKDVDGKVWNVQIQMTYVAVEDGDPNVARIQNAKAGTTGDNLMERTTDQSKLLNEDHANAGAKGQNYGTLKEDFISGSGRIQTKTVSGAGNIAYMPMKGDGGTAVHETLHLFGLGDRYTNGIQYILTDENGLNLGTFTLNSIVQEGFEGDLMSSQGLGFNQMHIDNLASKALSLSKTKGNNFVMANKVDNANNADKKAAIKSFPYGSSTYTKKEDNQ